MSRLVLGTRGSTLARWQADLVRRSLEGRSPELEVRTEIVRTRAENFPERPLEEIGVGVFTKELDDALRREEIDLAVHSLKDLPSRLEPDLAVAAVLARESPFDVFVSANGTPVRSLPERARIGTGSPRRRAQLLAIRPDLEVTALRGNVGTRLEKIASEGLAGTILAHAGLRRLGREDVVTEVLSADDFVPAVGQGAIAVVTRASDERTRAALASLEDPPTRTAIKAERAFLRELRGGCQVPAGAYAEVAGGKLRVRAVIASVDGRELVRGNREGPAADAEAIGLSLARDLLRDGGARLLGRS